MAKSKKKDDHENDIQVICRNRRAFHEYEIQDRLECGMVLTGTEVKSMRDRAPSIEDAYARIKDGELWLFGADIPEYKMGNLLNHKPKRPRKLLVHKRELAKFVGKASERGFTLIPLRIYFRNGIAKLELAVAKGKQLHDKREAQKQADAKKEIQRAMGRRR